MIQIDMEMPENCWDCKLGIASNGSLFCPILGTVVIDNSGTRDSDCPLQEAKEYK